MPENENGFIKPQPLSRINSSCAQSRETLSQRWLDSLTSAEMPITRIEWLSAGIRYKKSGNETFRDRSHGYTSTALTSTLPRRARGIAEVRKSLLLVLTGVVSIPYFRHEYVYRHKSSMSIHLLRQIGTLPPHRETLHSQPDLLPYFPEPAGPGTGAGSV